MKKHHGNHRSPFLFFTAVLLAALFCFENPGTVYAAETAAETAAEKTTEKESGSFSEEKAAISILEDQLAILQKNSENASESYQAAVTAYTEAQYDVRRARAVKEALDREVGALEAEIDTSRTLLAIYDTELAELDEEISEKLSEIDRRHDQFVERVRCNYEDSFISYLEILLSSESFADLLYRLDVVASLLDYDKRVLQSLKEAKDALLVLQTEKQSMKYNQQKTFESLTAKLPELENKVVESEEALRQYNAALETAMNRKDASLEEREAAKAAVEEAQKELDDAEEALAQKIREEQERLRREAEERARKEAEERARKEAEEKARREAEERARREEEQRKREEEERKRKEEEEKKRAEAEARGETYIPAETEAPVMEPEPAVQQTPNSSGSSVYGESVGGEYVGGEFLWPVDTVYAKISSLYGYRPNPFTGKQELHNGIDIPCDYGAAVYAGNSGTVIVAGYHYSYGNYVVIDHGGGISTLYAHNSKLLVNVGDVVTRGQQIAKAGSTGDSQGNHCHFSVRVDGYPTNPLSGYITQP